MSLVLYIATIKEDETLEICIENLPGRKVEKLTPKMVRRLLGIDNKEIAELCRQISLIPKRDERGQTYFSKEDVDVLQKIKNLHAQTSEIEQESNILNYNAHAVQRIPESFSIPPVEEEPAALVSSFSEMQERLVNKISKVIDEKLDGMDEVVVELIRCKTENETLRQKINELNKQVYSMKNQISSFKPLGLNLFIKQKSDILD